MDNRWNIRSGRPQDLPSLLEIYNHYVSSSHFTFDTSPVTFDERRTWFEKFRDHGPHRILVAEHDGTIAGYATSSPFHHKTVYARTVETGIYLSPDHCSRGLGSQLYGSLLDSLDAEPGIHRIYAGVIPPNEASMSLHLKLGFSVVGEFPEVSYKLGRYWGLCWLARPALEGRLPPGHRSEL